jgi:hypothetical protein
MKRIAKPANPQCPEKSQGYNTIIATTPLLLQHHYCYNTIIATTPLLLLPRDAGRGELNMLLSLPAPNNRPWGEEAMQPTRDFLSSNTRALQPNYKLFVAHLRKHPNY